MIDFEVDIFDRVSATVAPLCAKNRFVNKPIEEYVKLPAASLYEMDNRTVLRRQSSTPTENFVRLTYQLDVVAQTRAKCREIFLTADRTLLAMNFTRISGNFIPYAGGANVERYAARYEVFADEEGNLYRNA